MAGSEYINIPAYGAGSWKSPVATAVDLPTNGNTIGDVRVVQDTGIIYEWSGTAWNEAAGPGAAVTSLNGLIGALTLIAGANITITPGASTLTISSTSSGGTVTSVGLVDSTGLFNISGSPVTSSGTLTLSTFKNQAANTFFAAPSGSLGQPSFRTILAADIPTLNQNTTGTASNITATSNSTLTTLSSLSLPYSQLSGTVPTWNQNTTGTASNITAASNATITTLSALSLPASQVTGIEATLLTGYAVGANMPIAATDSILGAFEKVQGQINSLGSSEVTAVTATSPVFSSGGATPNITIQQSNTSQSGYLSSADWNTFNGKQAAGNYITSLTGDGTATGPGASALTLATVNSSPGSYGSATAVATFTVNGKGLLTASGSTAIQITESQVTNLVSDLAGKQPVGSYLTALTGDVVATGPGSVTATIQPNVVANAKLAQMAANTIKGNNTGSLANASDLTGAQVTALLSNFVGDTGSGGTAGIVPAPAAGTKAAGDFLKADGTWAYVDQSAPIYTPFSLVGITPFTAGINAKFENIVTYTGIDGYKQYAAVVAGAGVATLVIYDITDPAIPVMCSYVILAGAYNVAVGQISGQIYAFVPSSGGSSLYIRNITNPYSIGATSSILISGSPGSLYDCVYANGYVYIATQNKGLTVVDVGGGLAGGTITAPVQSYQEGGTTNKSAGIAISGNIVYTTNYQTTFPATVRYLKTWELAAGGGTLAVPYLANTYTIPGGPTPTSTKPSGVTISNSGTTAFVTDGNQGVINIIDVTSPTSPSYITYITPSYTLVTNTLEEVANSVSVNGNYLYVPSGANATNGGCIDLFDISTLSAPFKVRSVYTGVPNSVFGCMALNNGYIFVADYGVSGAYSGLDVFTQASLSPTFGLPVTSGLQVQQLTANTAVIANGSQQLASSSTTATELSYVHGVTSSIQTQINSLVAGGGISRIVSSVSTATSAGFAAKTDYVYFVSGATTITLPTAVGNTNLYTVKNTGSNTVTIATTSSQTIDGSLTITLPVANTSADIVSDGSNWRLV
jgi:hypothetical protein